jgi:hypothetical protein
MSAIRVAKPGWTEGGCWALVRRHVASLCVQETGCGNTPRPGHLTCRRHGELEEAAQLMAARLEARSG